MTIEEREKIARSAASDWCRCFKCDGIVNETGKKCEKPCATCWKWFDGYKTSLIALEKHKEQKPVEIHIDNPNVQKFDPDVKVTTSDSSADGKELLYVCNKSYKIGYRDGVNSVKPAEWSEEDEDMLNNIEYILHKDISYTPPTKPNSCTGYGNAYYTHQTEIDWLKSLRPQPKGTYQRVVHTIFNMLKDKDFYEIQPSNRVSLLNDIRVKCKDAIECAPILDETHWKPSEEQMDSLRDTIVHTKGYSYSMYLPELYEQLKAIKEDKK